jgi:uncharacterized protein (DUF2126 family)
MAGEVRRAARAHDEILRALGLRIWIGAEPTFTLRESQEPCWLFEAEGEDKKARARALLLAFAGSLGTSVRLVRAVGRQYPEEDRRRFAYGALWRRTEAGAGSVDASGLDGPPIEAPPPDPESAWLTVTPDPGVVEVNSAPAPDLVTFLDWMRSLHAAAAAAGLSAERYRFNGEAVDSGGGGQLTLGGPTPESSPFFRHPALLPGLLRYVNRHPSLSYGFAGECVGSACQGPRPDEGVRERFEELAVALDRLAVDGPRVKPEILWETLAPLLVDASGNTHRAEINVEKLWNPHLPGRGRLGLVELRALRMEPTPERATAVAALWRTLAARLSVSPYVEPLLDWGTALHDRFALPHELAADLAAVLADLEAHGLPLPAPLAAELLTPREPLAAIEMGGARITLTPALEFWPLVGDVASQESHGARIVDSSTSRVEVQVEAPSGEGPGTVAAAGWGLPLRAVSDDGARARFVGSVRYRTFVPRPGLHPGLPPTDPMPLVWVRAGRALSIELHGWIPGGGVYDGLPADAAEAARRRRERVIVAAAPVPSTIRAAPQGALSAWTLDLRRVLQG